MAVPSPDALAPWPGPAASGSARNPFLSLAPSRCLSDVFLQRLDGALSNCPAVTPLSVRLQACQPVRAGCLSALLPAAPSAPAVVLGPPNALTKYPLDKEGPTWAPPQPAAGDATHSGVSRTWISVLGPRGLYDNCLITQTPGHPDLYVSYTEEVTEQHVPDKREQAHSRKTSRFAVTLCLGAPQHKQ